VNPSDRAGNAPRERRTHAERTTETRARIMSAVVESIADLGYQKTTSAEIARRSGMTWGAVQHHFGGKDGILLAVLEDSFTRFAERLAKIDRDATSIETRISEFIDHSWEHFASDHYRSTFEILLNFTGPRGDDADQLWQGEMFTSWNAIWSELFNEAKIGRARTVTLQHYTISVLSGLASMKMLEGPTARIRSQELALLKDTLLRALLDSEPNGPTQSD
jgi:AcrR family transcriptional regulator